MNYIRFIRKRVNVIVYFGSKPNTDWDMVKVCQSMKESHKFRFDGATKEWYLTFRMDDFDPVLDNISSYDNLLGYFDNTQREKFTTFLKVKNKKYYEQIQGEKEESKKRTQKYLNRIIEYHHLNLYAHQKEDVQVLSKNTSTILGNEMGTGKALWEYSNVLTPDGWIKIKDINIGDEIINSDGLISNVTGVYPQGKKDLYKIIFSDDSEIICCKEHLWQVQSTNHKFRNNKFLIKTTNDFLIDGLQYKNGNNKWYIPIIKPIQQFNNNYNFIIHPYIMGCLLGDGHFHKNYISFSSADEEIINNIQKLLPNNILLNKKKNSKYDYIFSGKNRINSFNREIKKLNLYHKLSNTKFIPNEYKFTSLQNRIDLLQGLMDTDGWTLNRDNNLQFGTVSESLKNDILFIINSLGGVATTLTKIPKFKYKNNIKNGKIFYTLTIKLPKEIIPFKLNRKLNTYKPSIKYLPCRAIKSIEYYKNDNAICISTNSRDKLYITDNCILTHNTRSSVVYSEIQDFQKILIVCPASLKLNWKKEILMVNPSADICVLPEEKPMPYTKYYIINYDILIKEFTFEKNKVKKNKISVNLKPKSIFNKIKFDAMFIDEAHYIKNDSKRTRATLHFVDHIPHIIPISGTPIKSKVKDIYNLLLAIKHPLTKKGYFPFAQRYCGAYYNGFGWTYDGASNLEELYEHLKPYMIRKLKEECLDLPPKIITEVYVELSKEGQKEYETAFEDYLDFVRNEKLEGEDEVTKNIVIRNIEYAEHLVKLNLLKQICSRDKLPLIYERIEDLLDEDEDRKVIVFSQYTDTIAKLYTRFKDKAVKLVGSTNLEDRQKAIEEFQNNSNIRVFIGNTIAGGVGITLTKADVVIMADLLWTPADHVQAEDRAHRIGQHASVNVLYFLVKDSIEEDIFKLIQKKREIINKVIDNIDSVDENQKVNMLRTIIDNLNKKYIKK